jgi:hypothetical protein
VSLVTTVFRKGAGQDWSSPDLSFHGITILNRMPMLVLTTNGLGDVCPFNFWTEKSRSVAGWVGTLKSPWSKLWNGRNLSHIPENESPWRDAR